MNAAGRTHGQMDGSLPAEAYWQQLDSLQLLQAAQSASERKLGYAKLAVAALTAFAALFLLRHIAELDFLLVPVAAFVFLAVLQEKRIRRIKLRARAITFYERGLARLEDRWQGSGEKGEQFLDPLHPNARDLDIFGPASLFELVCTARTRVGEKTLAAWLLAAAPPDEVLGRQEAVRDLKDRVAFREQLFTLGETVRLGVHPEALAAWGERKPVFASTSTRLITRTLGLLWIASLLTWGVFGLTEVIAAITILNLAWSHRLYQRLDLAADQLEAAAHDLKLLAGVLALLENETLHAPRLLDLQAALKRDGIAPSVAIRHLARIVEYELSRHNPFGRLLGLVTFWNVELVFAAERWQQEFGPALRGWLSAVGELEALTALAGYAYEHPADVFPQFTSAGPVFEALAMAHPLLPLDKAVRNDFRLAAEPQLIVLSGPNMAGKSTFIRSIGVNAVLAQCGAPVRAAQLTLSPLTVAASICILDSLSGGVSRFYAEIHRIKLIFELSAGPIPILFLLDELLSGTNSHDRLTGSEFIARSLMERNAIGVVSTHDLALTTIPEAMGARAANFHFEDRYQDGELIFDYKLHPGIVQTSNALQLMRSIGLDVDG